MSNASTAVQMWNHVVMEQTMRSFPIGRKYNCEEEWWHMGESNMSQKQKDQWRSYVSAKNVDAVLLPSVSTFDSLERWKALITTRAFTHNFYILRANRIGEYADKDFEWHFYGDSFLASPNGEILNHLANKEELMIVNIEHKDVVHARRTWGFKDTSHKR